MILYVQGGFRKTFFLLPHNVVCVVPFLQNAATSAPTRWNSTFDVQKLIFHETWTRIAHMVQWQGYSLEVREIVAGFPGWARHGAHLHSYSMVPGIVVTDAQCSALAVQHWGYKHGSLTSVPQITSSHAPKQIHIYVLQWSSFEI